MPYTHVIALEKSVPIEDARGFFTSAVIVAGAIHGTPSLLLSEKPAIDSKRREVRIDCSSPVGECIARAFIGLVVHHHGGSSVVVAKDEDIGDYY